MWVATDRANRISQSFQVDAFIDPSATIEGHDTSQLYLKSSEYVFNESKRKS